MLLHSQHCWQIRLCSNAKAYTTYYYTVYIEGKQMHPVSQLHLPSNPQHHQNAAYLALST